MIKSVDVAVVGANVAGSSISYHLAKNDVKVVFLDLLPPDKIGSDSCGDGLDVHEFKRLGLEVPEGNFVYGDVIRGKVIAPDGKASMAAQGKIKAVQRYRFCQFLKDRAIDQGAELIAPARGLAPIIKNDFVVGLKYRLINSNPILDSGKSLPKDSGTLELRCKILVDASGLNAIIRKQLPSTWWVTEQIEKRDIAICYKESREFKKPLKEKFIHGYFTSKIAPGGFYWLATRSNTLINVGLGINLAYMPLSPKKQLYEKILPKHPILSNTNVTWHGGGQVPRRWPLSCMVGNGFLAAGDAAAMVNPMSGGGIGPSVYAGLLGGRVLKNAIYSMDYSIKGLWNYNYEYQINYGPVQAGNYILRRTIESLSDDQINALLGAELFSEEEIIAVIESGKLELGFLNKLKKLGKLAKHPKLLLKLRALYKNMENARKLYFKYPKNLTQFNDWHKQTRAFFKHQNSTIFR
jgi:electron-transferring-flavoprotein dehydrogenase